MINNEQPVLFTPETNVNVLDEMPQFRDTVVNTYDDWSLSVEHGIVVFNVTKDVFVVTLGGSKKYPSNIKLPEFESAAFIRAVNTLTNEEHRFYMKADDQRLLSFDNSQEMAILRELEKYGRFTILVETNYYDCNESKNLSTPLQKKFIEDLKACDMAAYSDADIRIMKLKYTNLDLLDAENEDVLKNIHIPSSQQNQAELVGVNGRI